MLWPYVRAGLTSVYLHSDWPAVAHKFLCLSLEEREHEKVWNGELIRGVYCMLLGFWRGNKSLDGFINPEWAWRNTKCSCILYICETARTVVFIVKWHFSADWLAPRLSGPYTAMTGLRCCICLPPAQLSLDSPVTLAIKESGTDISRDIVQTKTNN